MADWVVCAECNTRYDAQGVAFCPHCGSTAKMQGKASAAVASRRDPKRMRLQLGGVLILLVGGLFLASAGTLAVSLLVDPSALEGQLYDLYAQQVPDPPGGDLFVHVLDAGAPTQANISFLANGTRFASGSAVEGRFNASTQGHAAIQVNVTHGDRTWVRKVLVTSLVTTEITVDVAKDPLQTGRVEGSSSLVGPTTWAFLALSLFLVLGGLAAVLARWRGLALAGPLPVVAFTGLLVALLPSVGTLLLFAMVGVPYALVVSGRSAFRR